MKKLSFLPILLIITVLLSNTVYANEGVQETSESPALTLSAKSGFLIEQKTGKILYDYNGNEQLPPASVTKIMTMLLGMEAIDSGRISLSDTVYCSEYAASMGGSQVYLEPGEAMTVNDLFKAIAVASGNDASVMLAEYISGSCDSFISLMNQRAKELGMENTNFTNCTGLPDPNHYTTAHDIALMSAELLKHSKITDYTKIWMDTLRDGKFSLANTNKLLKQYSGITGLKTGSTDEALYCISASAERDGMQLIAVVLGAPTSEKRFNDAKVLLDYGFANYKSISIAPASDISPVKVIKGVSEYAYPDLTANMNIVVTKGKEKGIEKTLIIPETVNAPVKKGDLLGEIIVSLDGEEIGRLPLYAENDVQKSGFLYYFMHLICSLL